MALTAAGLEGIVAAESEICFIDGEAGILSYQGYEINTLAENATFEEVIYLLWQPRRSGFRRIGLDRTQPWRDVGGGALLFLAIGVPGILFYAITRLLGITVTVEASTLDAHWWTVPVLILAALRAGLQEEVIVVGYLFTRLRQLGWGTWPIILAAAVLRGSYHLYQGFGPFVGNAVMGVVFGWCYTRWGRVAPLVIAHTLIDIVSFVGYPLAASLFPHIFA